MVNILVIGLFGHTAIILSDKVSFAVFIWLVEIIIVKITFCEQVLSHVQETPIYTRKP